MISWALAVYASKDGAYTFVAPNRLHGSTEPSANQAGVDDTSTRQQASAES